MDLNIHTYTSREALYNGATAKVAGQLATTLDKKGNASLLLSGGSTPSPVYQRLSGQPLNWSSVRVGLVDERWVSNESPGSNEKLVRKSLLQDKATSATFIPMVTEAMSVFDGQADIEIAYSSFAKTDIVILGMGPDGHTASWFPGSTGLAHAMDPSTQDVTAAINAAGCPVAGDYLERITVTMPIILNASHVILLISGAEKRRVLEEDDRNLPIHTTLRARPDIQVYWAP